MISKIYHVSDIHIRLYKRHAEYETVFDRLFQYIESTKDSDSVIVLAGDIVHSKTDMSPELISVTSKFLKRCADTLPTILIAGNHDAVRNQTRLDALSPIVESLDHPNLHYWKMAGVYRFNGVAFSVFSILDKRENWVYANDISDPYKIALYHGPIMGSVNDAGTAVGTYGISADLFNEFDLGICGDIHKFQWMNRSKTVGYSSSLICQGYGEHPTKHGILLWDLSSRSAKFVRIPNDYAYVTFVLEDGQCKVPDGLPHNLRVRIQHKNSTPLQIQAFLDELSSKYNVIESTKQKVRINNISTLEQGNVLGNSRDVQYQNELISEYLSSIDSGMTNDELEAVCQLNVDTNRSISSKPAIRNTLWKPKKLEFSNMFSYGEDNVIDFDSLDGLYGIFSPNAHGKSSLLGALCFALYDKTPTSTKSAHVLNINADEFSCKLQFDMDGIDYYIERRGYRKPDGAVRVDVDFWTEDVNGTETSLNGEDRDKTNFAIREYVGQYEDFLMTALSTQYDNQSFVEKSQKERKELLYKFLDISIYDDLYKVAKETAKEYATLIRSYEREDLRQRIDELIELIEVKETDLTSINDQWNLAKSAKSDKNDELVALNKDFIPVDESMTRDHIDANIIRYETQLSDAKLELEKIKRKIRDSKLLYRQIDRSLIRPDNVDIDLLKKNRNDCKIECDRIDNRLKSVIRDIDACETKQRHLSDHEYDPNCKYCISNPFVKDAKLAIDQLPELKAKKFQLEMELAHWTGEAELAELLLSKANTYVLVNQKLAFIQSDLDLLAEKQNRCKTSIKSLQIQINNAKKKLIEYERNQKQIELNLDISRSIEKIKGELFVIDKMEHRIGEQYKTAFTNLELLRREHGEYTAKLNTYIDYLNKYRIYELYLKALSREGVPYKIVQAVLPVIENDVNIILQQIVDFTVRLDSTDEKYIHSYIVYGDKPAWPIELSSGMERFVLSLAFRQALSEITSLPKANFMAIDEGFGVLDSENLLSIGRLFSYLKTQYDYLLVISHIDSMRDLVDKQIKIDKIDGYSKIVV